MYAKVPCRVLTPNVVLFLSTCRSPRPYFIHNFFARHTFLCMHYVNSYSWNETNYRHTCDPYFQGTLYNWQYFWLWNFFSFSFLPIFLPIHQTSSDIYIRPQQVYVFKWWVADVSISMFVDMFMTTLMMFCRVFLEQDLKTKRGDLKTKQGGDS